MIELTEGLNEVTVELVKGITPAVFYSPYGCIRTGLYYCRHNPGHADTCDPTPPPVSPPYWNTIEELMTSMENLQRGWGGNFGGLSILEDCGYCANSDVARYTYGVADFHCPYCGMEFTYGPAGGPETYPQVLGELFTHIEQSHPEFPLNKPPCWIITTTFRWWPPPHYTYKVVAVTPGTYGTVTLSNWGDRCKDGEIITWESLTGERVPA